MQMYNSRNLNLNCDDVSVIDVLYCIVLTYCHSE